MYIPKRYGESKTSSCPFCGSAAFLKSPEGVPVCKAHAHSSFGAMKCACGSFLDLRDGKWGPFFVCHKCGIVTMSRALELNPDLGARAEKTNTSSGSNFTKQHPMMGNRRTASQNMFKNPDGSDKYVRSDDPRFGFR